jgi:hypothetical protein
MATQVDVTAAPSPSRSRTALAPRSPHRALIVLLCVGAAIRLVAVVLYPNAVLENYDSGWYMAGGLFDDPREPSGYHLLLAALRLVWPATLPIVLLQHLMGLATGVIAYALAREAGVARGWAAAAAAPILLAGEVLYLEHSVMTETLITLLLAGALLLLVRAGRRRSLALAALAGLLLGLCAITRSIGVPLAVVGVAWLAVLAPQALGARLRLAAGTAVTAAAVVGVYLAVATTGTHPGLFDNSSLYAYARVGQFADCSRFTPPAGTRSLCESTPTKGRPGPRFYAGDPASPGVRLEHTDPAHAEGRLGAFARAAALGEPLAYANAVVIDGFRYLREDVQPNVNGTYGTGFWGLDLSMVRMEPSALVVRAAQSRYPSIHASVPRGQKLWAVWDGVLRVGGLVLALIVLLAVAAPFLRGPGRRVAALCTVTGLALMIVPIATLIWNQRYAEPAYVPLAVSAAVAAAALAGRVRRAA